MAYVDGYVIPVPKKTLAAYMKMAKAASKIFRKHGAIRCANAPAMILTSPGAALRSPSR